MKNLKYKIKLNEKLKIKSKQKIFQQNVFLAGWARLGSKNVKTKEAVWDDLRTQMEPEKKL